MATLSLSSTPSAEHVEALVRVAVEAVPLPPGVKLRRVELTEDWSGDPAVYLRYVNSTKIPLTPKRVRVISGFSRMVQDKVYDLRIGLMPYVRWDEVH